MCGFDKILVVLVFYWWILTLRGNEVIAYEYFNDILNPANLEIDVWHQRNARVAIRTNDKLDCEQQNVYICEEPPNLVPPDARKTCNYRNYDYHEQVYRWVAGQGCLFYTPNFLYVAGYRNINLSAGCFYGNLYAPCLEVPKEDGTCGCYPFDPGLEEVVTAVSKAMVPSAQGRWERCFYAASDCCSHVMLSEVNSTSTNKCEATFDAWTCWHQADPGTTATEVCSEFAYSNVGPSCNHFSSKRCFENATWDPQTDYSTCSITPRLLRRYRFHIAMLAFSIASCLPAVIIFFMYKRLRITRVALHRNLLIAIIVRNVLVIVSRSEIYIDEITNSGDTVLSSNGWACRVLGVAERIAANAVFVCMLVEGIYLHRLIVAVFKQNLKVKWLYLIGAFIAVLPVVAWAAVMGVYNNHSCWLIYTVDNVQWILDAPRILILVINTGLFIDVLRVLLTKLRNAENANQLSTTKATLFLMPIFGTQFLLTAFRPNTTNCTGEQIYYYVAYTVEGLQGFIVAMLYCYVNKEVRMLLKTTYRKTESAVVSRVRRDSAYPRMSIDPKSDRRFTYSTALPPQNADDPKDQYATIAPKLHVAEIISIQASERLADILEPVYETIENGVINEGYDSLERSSVDNDSGFIANRDSKGDNYYGFTNVSSVSIDCQDWIKCISSPSSSVYNNSLNDYETRYLERRFPNHPKPKLIAESRRRLSENADVTGLGKKWSSSCDEKLREIVEAKKRLSLSCDDRPKDITEFGKRLSVQEVITESDKSIENVNTDDNKDLKEPDLEGIDNESDYEDCDTMLEEILQYIETNDNNVALNPELLSPNRKDDEKIVFVDE
ncbi:uncharacterized protein LOC114357030 [Ostrinia furnacalis]|uniref:uncharacterized protein LOC114357030 n=1 Tax=Ostrinia furnacalis TaxID=93504 RepID=UPI00103B7A31|nr:uncharacterized protein LOC114357030 [Ostrinia furnacalis]